MDRCPSMAWTSNKENSLTHSKQDGFNEAQLHDWSVGSTVAGHAKSFQGFTWLEVEGAGHMVPHDVSYILQCFSKKLATSQRSCFIEELFEWNSILRLTVTINNCFSYFLL